MSGLFGTDESIILYGARAGKDNRIIILGVISHTAGMDAAFVRFMALLLFYPGTYIISWGPGGFLRKGKAIRMFRRIAGFFRRLFSSKGFRRSFRIFLGVFAVYYIYNVILFITVVMDTGASLGEALRFYFSLPFFDTSWVPPSAGIALGIAIGLAWSLNRKRNNRGTDEPEEKPEGSPDTVREEEIIETTHYKYQ